MAISDTDIILWTTDAATNKPTDATFIGRDLARQKRNIKSIVREESLEKQFEKTGYITTTAVHFGAGVGVLVVSGEGDLTATFTPMRKLRMTPQDGGTSIYVGIDTCTYNGGLDTNTLVVCELTDEVANNTVYELDVGTENPSAISLPQYYEAGTVTIEDTDTFAVGAFARFQSFDDLHYFVKTNVVTATGAAPSDVVTEIEKEASQITIHIKAAPGGGNSTVIAWGVFRGMP